MKLFVTTLVSLMISSFAGAQSYSPHLAPGVHPDGAATPEPQRSGSTNPATMRSHTMQDHDKMFEMCRSMRPSRHCTEILDACEGEADPVACMRGYSRK